MSALLGTGRNADTWTCKTCGAVYHELDPVDAHARSGEGHTLFTASYQGAAEAKR